MSLFSQISDPGYLLTSAERAFRRNDVETAAGDLYTFQQCLKHGADVTECDMRRADDIEAGILAVRRAMAV